VNGSLPENFDAKDGLRVTDPRADSKKSDDEENVES